MASVRPNSVNGVVFSGIFAPKMRPCVATATLLTIAIRKSWGEIDRNTEPSFQTNSSRNQFCFGIKIMSLLYLWSERFTRERRPPATCIGISRAAACAVSDSRYLARSLCPGILDIASRDRQG